MIDLPEKLRERKGSAQELSEEEKEKREEEVEDMSSEWSPEGF